MQTVWCARGIHRLAATALDAARFDIRYYARLVSVARHPMITLRQVSSRDGRSERHRVLLRPRLRLRQAGVTGQGRRTVDAFGQAVGDPGVLSVGAALGVETGLLRLDVFFGVLFTNIIGCFIMICSS